MHLPPCRIWWDMSRIDEEGRVRLRPPYTLRNPCLGVPARTSP
jgi:hypothetical protein